MKNPLTLLLIANLLSVTSCKPFYYTKIEQTIPISNTEESIQVFGLSAEIPDDAEVLGTVKVGESGFTATKNCTFENVLNTAKERAKAAGGNALKIVYHIPPGKSTCHRIKAKILRLQDIKTVVQNTQSLNKTYAILNIYCEPDTNYIDYDLHLNDSIICKVSKNLRTSVAVKKEGLNTIWAQIDQKTEIQVNIEFGQVYYLKCNLLPGDAGKQPLLRIVDSQEGSRSFNLF